MSARCAPSAQAPVRDAGSTQPCITLRRSRSISLWRAFVPADRMDAARCDMFAGDDAATTAPRGGACWVFVRARFGQFMYGLYPAGRALARRSRGPLPALPGRAALAASACPAGAPAPVAALLALPPLGIWLLAGGFGLPGRDARMGRADADHLHRDLCRADRDSARHPARARAAIEAAGHPHAVGRSSSSSGAACRSSR